MKTLLTRLAATLTIVIVPACALHAAGDAAKPVPATAVETDPDLPAAHGEALDKSEYLARRSAHIALLRGLDHPDAVRRRSAAIREMERQEAAQRGGGSNAFGVSSPLLPDGGPPSISNWTPLGPAPIPNGQTTTRVDPVSGRVSAIAVHPTNPNIVYVGAAQGGVYRTLDGGATWMPLMDGALSLAIGSITIDPLNASTIFVGTGEGNLSADSFFGVGLYIIKNADTVPVVTGPFNKDATAADVFTNRSIVKILVSPTDDNIVFLATSSGIGGLGADAGPVLPLRGLYRSTNAMAASPVFTRLNLVPANTNVIVTSAVLEPGNPNNLVASVYGQVSGQGGIYRTTNALDPVPANVTFTQTLSLATNGLNIKMDIVKIGATVTVLAGTGESSGTLRRSTDGGATWSAAIPAAAGFCGGQCFYDIVVGMDPANASAIYLGGSSGANLLKKSTDAGATFPRIDTGLHADSHAIAVAPSNPAIVYFGNDGGIWRSADAGATWVSRNTAGFQATQFQSLATHPTDANFMIGGTQDNGTECMGVCGANTNPAAWSRADFGDGGFSLIDRNAADTATVTMYHTYFNQTNNLIGVGRTSTTACATEAQWSFKGIYGGTVDPTVHCDGSTDTFNGITITDSVLFYAPIALGPGNPNTLYYGSDRLYRSANQGDTMALASQAPIVAAIPISAIGISPQDDNFRLVGLRNGRVFYTNTGISPLIEITGFPAKFVSRAVFLPGNKSTAFITFAGFGTIALPVVHVWKCTALDTATPVCAASGTNIPDVPVNAFAADPVSATTFYAGSDIGVYRSTDSGASWFPYGAGLPRVAVFDLAFQGTSRFLRAATHGRGIWQIGPRSQTEVPASTLLMGKSGVTPGNLTAAWGATCSTLTSNYTIHEGTLGVWYSHNGLLCSTGGIRSADFAPTAGSRYYLVVSTDGNYEGSYGSNSSGAAIPPSAAPCNTQAVTNICG